MFFKKQLFLLVLVTLIAFSMRIYKLTASPEGLAIDETSIGYNAYSIITTGRDEHGEAFPIFFEAFGEYKLPVYIYSVAFTQLLLGPTDASIRIPAVVFGTASIIVFYFLLSLFFKQSQNRDIVAFFGALIMAIAPWHFQFTHAGFEASSAIFKSLVPLLAALLLAVSPWHYHFSRPGFEANAALFFQVLGLWLFYRAVRVNSFLVLLGSVLSFVISLYTYNSARIIAPVLLGTLTVLYFKNFRIKYWISAFGIGLLVSIPFILFAITPGGAARMKQVSIFFFDIENPYQEFVKNYWESISPETLFDKGNIHFTEPYKLSLLYKIELPFLLIGLLAAFVWRKKALIPVIILFFIGFIPAAMAVPNPHALRSLSVLPALLVCSALGVGIVLYFLRDRILRVAFMGMYLLFLSGFIIQFLNSYHYEYLPTRKEDIWPVATKEALLFAKNSVDRYHKIYFDPSFPQIVSLWYLQVDPSQYLNAPDRQHLDPYYFNVTAEQAIDLEPESLYLTHEVISDGELIHEIYPSSGEPPYKIWRINRYNGPDLSAERS